MQGNALCPPWAFWACYEHLVYQVKSFQAFTTGITPAETSY